MMTKNQNSTSSQFERHVSNMLGPNMLGPRAERRVQSPVTCLGPFYTADWANRRRANNVEIRAGNRHPMILPQKLRSRRPAGLKRVAQIPWQGHNQKHRPAIVCTQTPIAPVQFEEYNWVAGEPPPRCEPGHPWFLYGLFDPPGPMRQTPLPDCIWEGEPWGRPRYHTTASRFHSRGNPAGFWGGTEPKFCTGEQS